MGLDTKTYWLTDRQSQCDFDFDFDLFESDQDSDSDSFELVVENLIEFKRWQSQVIEKKWQERN
jgi:hypothetical protein